MAENPKVTSKFDRMHGHPRKPGRVITPGQPARGGAMDSTSGGRRDASGASTRFPVTPVTDHREQDQHRRLHHEPSTLGHMERGDHAGHPRFSRRGR